MDPMVCCAKDFMSAKLRRVSISNASAQFASGNTGLGSCGETGNGFAAKARDAILSDIYLAFQVLLSDLAQANRCL